MTESSASPLEKVETIGAGQPPNVRIPPVPTIYADQVADVLYGSYTTKVLLGVENGSAELRPVATVVMPTALLLKAAISVISDLTSEDMVKEAVERYGKLTNDMNELREVIGRALDSVASPLEKK